jgi:hypothetical protein
VVDKASEVEIPREKESEVKAVTLLYHDAVTGDDFDESGFPGAGADLYKLSTGEMDAHLREISLARDDGPVGIYALLGDQNGFTPRRDPLPLMLTFDDGGVGASLYIADLLDRYGWKAHFFITTDYIGKPRFMSEEQLRDLQRRGHIIGSHSCSHPARMSSCGHDRLVAEWQDSVTRLGDILGIPVDTASVPGGYYSRSVARIASACGIRALFTSEPVRKSYLVDRCLVLGRYTIIRGMGPGVSRVLSTGRMSSESIRQYSLWNLKKGAKILGGRYYNAIRDGLLKK